VGFSPPAALDVAVDITDDGGWRSAGELEDRVKVAAGDWFARERVDEVIWRLWEPFVDRFARCNIWFVRGRDRALLVDTGLGVASLREAARDLFEQSTVALATHYHFDHTGSLHEFTERLAHKAGVPYLATPGAIGGALRRDAFPPAALEMYLAAGYEVPADLLDALPEPAFDPSAYEVQSCTPTRVLDDGDIVDLGDRAFEVMHLPGHSPDSIGLYDAASGTLFSGDAVYDGPLLDGSRDSDVDAYVATMERLRALPVEVVHGGHEPSFGRDRLVELCDAYIARVRSR
jgi:glyoxylase-like metal-dependent hydrolase (beta-lactamase superfamily II)